MTLVDEQGEREKEIVEQLLSSTPPFVGVDRVDVELGDDHTGDPSLWLVFRLHPELQSDVPWVEAFTTYSTDLTLKILKTGLTRFPYTRIERAA